MIRFVVFAAVLVLAAGSHSFLGQGDHVPVRGSDVTAGATVFQHSCVMCHAITPNVKIVGPSLYSVMRGPRALPAKTVTGIVWNGKGRMPGFRQKLSNADTADLLAYLHGL